MSNTASTFRVAFTVIHTSGATLKVAFSPSVKEAIKTARAGAWVAVDEIMPSNVADCWMTIHKGGREIFSDFADW